MNKKLAFTVVAFIFGFQYRFFFIRECSVNLGNLNFSYAIFPILCQINRFFDIYLITYVQVINCNGFLFPFLSFYYLNQINMILLIEECILIIFPAFYT